jgi:hypothetical protein
MSEEEHLGDCINCSKIRCFNLYKKSEENPAVGAELHVYSILGRKIEDKPDLRAHTCVNGEFLNAACFLSYPVLRDHKESYLSDILVQVARDFKASIFLAFSGHYRQAMQVLRCAFENIVSGLYFQSDYLNLTTKKAKAEDFARLDRRFNQWKRNGRGNIHKEIEILRRIDFLSMDEERDWHNMYSLLSRFVHTPEEFIIYVKHTDELKKMAKIACPATTYFSEEQLVEWSDRFQNVFTVFLRAIARFHPEAFSTESGKLAVTKCIVPYLNEFGHRIRTSEEIRKMLSTV